MPSQPAHRKERLHRADARDESAAFHKSSSRSEMVSLFERVQNRTKDCSLYRQWLRKANATRLTPCRNALLRFTREERRLVVPTKSKSLYSVHPGIGMVQKWIAELLDQRLADHLRSGSRL